MTPMSRPTGRNGRRCRDENETYEELLMGLGLSRNQVNRMVNTQRREGSKKVSNALYWIVAQKHINDCGPELLPCLSSLAFEVMAASIMQTRQECYICRAKIQRLHRARP